MKPRLADVAALAGVSSGTVSNVLNGRRARDDAIGRAVLGAVARLDYRVNEAASNLRRSRSSAIGMVVPDLRNPFFARLVDEFHERAGDAGYRLFATTSRECVVRERTEIESLLRWKVAGLAVVPAGDGSAFTAAGLRIEAPCLVLDRVPARCVHDSVAVDDAGAVREALTQLVRTGHRRVLIVHVATDAPNMRVRLAASRRMLGGSPEGAKLVGVCARPATLGDTREDAATDAALALALATRPDSAPDAILSLSVLTTRWALRVSGELGLVVPRDISLIGFDDSRWLDLPSPGIDAIGQPIEALAAVGWRALLARVEGRVDRRPVAGLGDGLAGLTELATPRAAVLQCDLRRRGSIAERSSA